MRVPHASFLASASAVVLTALLAMPAGATCGGEGCPFVHDGVGAQTGRFAFGLRYQNVTQDQLWEGSSSATRDDLIADIFTGGGIHSELELYTRTRTWVAEGRARLLPRFELIGTLPYLQREHRHMLVHAPFFNPAFVDEWRYEGLGDATLLGQARALEPSPGSALVLIGGVKLPTGRRHVPDEERENFAEPSTLEPGARPGTGSTDWIGGAQFTQALPWSRALALTASVQARRNGRGTDDYRVGDEFLAGLSGGYRPVEWLTLLGQVNFSAHGSDESAEEGEAAHSGVRTLYLTPGASVRLSPTMSLFGLYQARVWGETDEANVVGANHFLFGTTYTLGH